MSKIKRFLRGTALALGIGALAYMPSCSGKSLEEKTSTVSEDNGTEKYALLINGMPVKGDFSEAACVENKGDICTESCNSAKDEDDKDLKKRAYVQDKRCCG